jgi:hypothetical protein
MGRHVAPLTEATAHWVDMWLHSLRQQPMGRHVAPLTEATVHG